MLTATVTLTPPSFRRSLSFDHGRSKPPKPGHDVGHEVGRELGLGVTPDADWLAQLEGRLSTAAKAEAGPPLATPVRRSFSFTRGVTRGTPRGRATMGVGRGSKAKPLKAATDSGAPESGGVDLFAARTAALFDE